MIIFGYPGVGKTSIAKEDYRFIDLDIAELDPLTRGFGSPRFMRKDWVNNYCNMALLLSRQGYFVFVSTHPEVTKKLIAKEKKVCLVFPDARLKEEWIKMLFDRYQSLPKRATHNAWRRAKEHFDEDITAFEKMDCPKLRIMSMKRNLKRDIVAFYEARYMT